MRVQRARDIQQTRFSELSISANSEMSAQEVKEYCFLDLDAQAILQQAVENLDLSARSYYRILKLSRTIADLGDEKDISSTHILEALSYRKKE